MIGGAAASLRGPAVLPFCGLITGDHNPPLIMTLVSLGGDEFSNNDNILSQLVQVLSRLGGNNMKLIKS